MTTSLTTPNNSRTVDARNETVKYSLVACGPNECSMRAGRTVAEIRRAFAGMLNISRDAAAFVDGKPAYDSQVINGGQSLMFVRLAGRKGLGEVWNKDEFVKRLRHFNEADWAKWIAEGLPHETLLDGTIILNETQFDAWLKRRYEQRTLGTSNPRKYNKMELAILEVVTEMPRTGEELAHLIGVHYDGHIKGTLSVLVKTGELKKEVGGGYYRTL